MCVGRRAAPQRVAWNRFTELEGRMGLARLPNIARIVSALALAYSSDRAMTGRYRSHAGATLRTFL